MKELTLRSRCRYQDLGEKTTKHFFNLENRNFTSKVMNKIIDDGMEYTETKDILNCQKEFYSTLCSENNDLLDENIEKCIGENENKLSDLESESLEGEIKYCELTDVLKKMKNGKSPEQDGFTVQFKKYIYIWTVFGHYILRSLNYGYRTGSLSITRIKG